MGKFCKVIPFLLFFIQTAVSLPAQEVDSLPDDPRIKTGKLANGLSYYIVKNQARKGYADFCLAQQTGTVLEERNQRGMFKMLQRLALRGTRNFNDSTITAYFHTLGLNPADLVFDTREDALTYKIKNVPLASSNTLDSSLLVLYNWMSSINIDEEDILREIPYLKNLLLSEQTASRRMNGRLLRAIFPRSPYAQNPDGLCIEDIDGFSSKEIRNFYYKWFRPDLQAVVVVGDIDPVSVETRIKSVFSTIPKPLKAQKRTYYTPKTVKGTKVCILKDREYEKVQVRIDYLKNTLPDGYRNTSVPFIEQYMNETACRLLADRIREDALPRDVPVYDIKVETGKFMNMKNTETVSISFETLPDMVYSGLSFVRSEIDRLKEYGFTRREYLVSKEIFVRKAEFLYNNREEVSNELYTRRVLDHYLEGLSLASLELQYELIKEILGSVTPRELDLYARSLFSQTDNIVLSCRMPDVAGIESISAGRVLESFNNALTRAQTSDLVTEVLKWPEESLAGGTSKIISDVSDPVTGSRVLILSNGATAVLKKTVASLDTVSFKAVSKGGLSRLPEINFSNGDFINGVLNLGGLNGISQPNWERLYAYEDLCSHARILPDREEVTGRALKGNEDKLFQLLKWNFTARREDYTAYNLFRKKTAFENNYACVSPERVFRDSVLHYNFENRRYIQPVSAREIERTHYQSLLPMLRGRFSNAADFTFIFTGDLDESRFRELALKYIGSIPGDVSRRENWLVVPHYFTKGRTEKHFLYQMVNPRTYVSLTYSHGCPFHLENMILGEMTRRYLHRMLNMGKPGNFSPEYQVRGQMYCYPEEIFTLHFLMNTSGATHAAKVSRAVDAALCNIADRGPRENLFREITDRIKEDFKQKSQGNNYWQQVLEQRYIRGKDFHSNYLSVLENITPAKFRDFIQALVREGNRVSVTMEGTTEDVNSPNLMKDNAFIREFFAGE